MGTGNGHLLFELVGNGYNGKHLKGVDYSRPSIKLSYYIAKSRGKDCEAVSFDVLDVLDQQQIKQIGEWDVVMDKGTFGEHFVCTNIPSNRCRRYLSIGWFKPSLICQARCELGKKRRQTPDNLV